MLDLEQHPPVEDGSFLTVCATHGGCVCSVAANAMSSSFSKAVKARNEVFFFFFFVIRAADKLLRRNL